MMRLSIITINYNNYCGLRNTINSVVSQTWKDFEWIIIDGGSSDGSKELIEGVADYTSFWCSEPDAGIYNAMNKGIVNAKGEYLMFLNSGDYLANPNTLQKVFAKDHTADILYGSLLIAKDGVVETVSVPSNITARYLLYHGTILHTGGSFIKKKLFDSFGLYNESLKIVADWEFWIRSVVIGGASLEDLGTELSFFELGGTSAGNMELHLKERLRVVDELIPKLIRKDYEAYEDALYTLRSSRRLSSLSYRLLIKAVIFKFFSSLFPRLKNNIR